MIRLRVAFRPSDWRVGVAYDAGDRRLLVSPLPTVTVAVERLHRRCEACGLPSFDGSRRMYRPWRHYRCHPVGRER